MENQEVNCTIRRYMLTLKLLKAMLHINFMSKIFIPIGTFALLVFLIIWLWQRQPTTPIKSEPPQKVQTQNDQKQNLDETLKIQNNLVVKSQKAQIKGKINPLDYFIIASSSFSKITRANEKGDFEIEISLEKGLNLLDYATTSKDLKKLSKNSLTYYLLPDSPFKTVYAGSVKSIFDTLVTITTPSGDINARTSSATELEIPSPDETEKPVVSSLKNVRVGDYAISLGESIDQNSQTSQKLTVIRQDKPQNTAKIISAQIITSPNKNVFSVKNLSDEKIIELLTSKDTQIQLENLGASPTPTLKSTAKTPEASQIVKDKNAIIIYHDESGKNIVDLIYLLP